MPTALKTFWNTITCPSLFPTKKSWPASPWVIESHDVPFMNHVHMQAAMQKYVDNSISSTVNLKNSATPGSIYRIYLTAWESGCKGITVFRDGCRRGNILGVGEDDKKEMEKKERKTEGKKEDSQKETNIITMKPVITPPMPKCHSHHIHIEGHCSTCEECGWSACGL